MEIKENERLSLLYATFIKSGVLPVKPAIDNSSKGRGQYKINVVFTLNNMSVSQGKSKAITNTNICFSQKFENILLLYDICQLVEPNA